MESIKTAAEKYVSPKALNIADLKKVSVEVPIEERHYKSGTAEEFTAWIATIDNQEYRVPNSVLGGIQMLLEGMPAMKYFRVIKKGEGITTTYNVIPFQPE